LPVWGGNFKFLKKTLVTSNDLSLQKAMEVIGFLPDEISAALELLAAILNIGNATFEGYSLPNGTDACKMSAESTTCKFQDLNDSPLHVHNSNQKEMAQKQT